MWRSIVAARASLSHKVTQSFSTTQNPKVNLLKALTVYPPPMQNSLTWVFSKPSILQNLVFISHFSTESSVETTGDAFTDASNAGFDQNPYFVGISESDNSAVTFVENSELGSQQFGSFEENSNAQMGIFDENSKELESFGDNVVHEVEEGVGEVHEIDVEKLESVLSLLQSSVDGSLESSLDSLDLTLHENFVVRVLETPLVQGENFIRFFKWASRKPGFSVNTRVVYSLVRAISGGLKKKDAYAVWDLVREIGEKENGVLNVEILNELIALFSRLGKGKAGFEVFNKFGEFGCVPNEDTYYFTIDALCRRSIHDWAVSVCEKMLDVGSLPDSDKIGQIISWLCKGKKAEDAHRVYLLAKEKNKYPPQFSVNFLISSLSREDETVQLALEMLKDFPEEGRIYAIKPFSAVIRGLCRIKDLEGAKRLLSKMIDDGPPPGNAVFNLVINSLSKAGDMEEAKAMMKLMESRGLKPDVYAYSVIMSGYAKGGQMEDACEVLSEAKRKHPKLCPVTYHTLIRGYCKLEEFDKALKLLSEMKDYGVQPNADEYNKLIQSLCLKTLDWETAEKLLEEMKENGLHLNGITRGLIRAVKELEEEGVETREVLKHEVFAVC